MAHKLNPYIGFGNNARAAMEFYKSVLGGDLTMTTFKDGGMAGDGPEGDKIMHAQLETANGMTLMASDTPEGMDMGRGSSISISLSGDDDKELRGYWDKLSAGGNVIMPLEVAPWGDAFGMCSDKFGINWMVNIAGKRG